MTLGEFRKYTELLPDEVNLAFSYDEDHIPVNTFVTNGTNLILCSKVYMMENKKQIYTTILQIAANYENTEKGKNKG